MSPTGSSPTASRAHRARTVADGTTETVRLPVDMWNLGRSFTYQIPGTRAVRAAELDPRSVYPDVDRSNNRR